MEFLPILSALRRNKVGAILVAVQIALTLAVVANALSIIQHHLSEMRRPSGVDEANIFTLRNRWVGQPEDLRGRIEADLTALRTLRGVIDAVATNSYPLLGGGFSFGLRLKPDQKQDAVQTTLYFSDSHGLDALGLKLIQGRWFTASEIGEFHVDDIKGAPGLVITSSLARKLFPAGNALGRSIYMMNDDPMPIVGIVERAQTPWPGVGDLESFVENSTFMPYVFVNNGLAYVVRTRPGQLAAVMHAAPARLLGITRQRVIHELMPFTATRTRAYQVQQATSWLLEAVSGLLLVITALGTVGLTMYWVSQRRREIGMRRALGARRVDILRYFQTENLLISGTGALLGVATGLGANLWMASHLAITRMSVSYIGAGAAIVLILSQLAVLGPALRAASISPSLATRGL